MRSWAIVLDRLVSKFQPLHADRFEVLAPGGCASPIPTDVCSMAVCKPPANCWYELNTFTIPAPYRASSGVDGPLVQPAGLRAPFNSNALRVRMSLEALVLLPPSPRSAACSKSAAEPATSGVEALVKPP